MFDASPEKSLGDCKAPSGVVNAKNRWPVPHPIPYQGSKRSLAPLILSYFPERFERLVEPFAGSAAISLATASRGSAGKFLINDSHEPIAALWTEILRSPDKLANEYEKLWNDQIGNERNFFDQIRSKFNKSRQPAYLLYLLARCVKAAIRYNASGDFNNSPDNRRKGAHPSTMRSRIMGAFRLLGGLTEVSSRDYLEVIDRCGHEDLIYMDPPYQGVCGNRDNRYAPKFEHRKFCDCLKTMNERKLLYILSYDGRTGSKVYGEPLPAELELHHLEIHAGRSSQATLLGRSSDTYESLYISPALVSMISAGGILVQLPNMAKANQKSFDW